MVFLAPAAKVAFLESNGSHIVPTGNQSEWSGFTTSDIQNRVAIFDSKVFKKPIELLRWWGFEYL